jgi:hypothetical protein
LINQQHTGNIHSNPHSPKYLNSLFFRKPASTKIKLSIIKSIILSSTTTFSQSTRTKSNIPKFEQTPFPSNQLPSSKFFYPENPEHPQQSYQMRNVQKEEIPGDIQNDRFQKQN